MYCPYCGVEVSEGLESCPVCGAKFETVPQSAEQPVEVPMEPIEGEVVEMPSEPGKVYKTIPSYQPKPASHTEAVSESIPQEAPKADSMVDDDPLCRPGETYNPTAQPVRNAAPKAEQKNDGKKWLIVALAVIALILLLCLCCGAGVFLKILLG